MDRKKGEKPPRANGQGYLHAVTAKREAAEHLEFESRGLPCRHAYGPAQRARHAELAGCAPDIKVVLQGRIQLAFRPAR